MIRVPQYQRVTVENGGVLTAQAWDGNTGGFVAFLSNGTVTIDGTITISGKGYRGGPGNIGRGNQGEGTTGVGMISLAANGNGGGGGGGVNENGVGGGGGNGGIGGSSTTTDQGYRTGGFGGTTSGSTDLSTLTFGGGGGAGGGGVARGGDGGNGGGAILIFGKTMSVSGFYYIEWKWRGDWGRKRWRRRLNIIGSSNCNHWFKPNCGSGRIWWSRGFGGGGSNTSRVLRIPHWNNESAGQYPETELLHRRAGGISAVYYRATQSAGNHSDGRKPNVSSSVRPQTEL